VVLIRNGRQDCRPFLFFLYFSTSKSFECASIQSK